VSFVNKKAYWKTSVTDYACGAAALIGLVLWYITSDGTLAIAFSIIADFFAAIPTFKKSYTHPESEDFRAYGELFRLFEVTRLVAMRYLIYSGEERKKRDKKRICIKVSGADGRAAAINIAKRSGQSYRGNL